MDTAILWCERCNNTGRERGYLWTEEACEECETPFQKPTLGEALRLLRHDAGKNLGEVSSVIGRPVSYASDCERGYYVPTAVELGRWCDLLGLSLTDRHLLVGLWATTTPRQREHTIHTLHGSWATGDRASESVEEDCG